MEVTHPISSNPMSAPSAGHPLVLAAAASVTVLSLAGVAFLAGWLPGPAIHTPAPAATQAAVVPPPAQPSPSISREPTRQAQTAAAPRHVRTQRSTAPEVATATPRESTPVTLARSSTPVTATLPSICRECGVVESVQEVPVEGKGSGGGAIAGGIVGGFLGNQIGRGTTRDIATVLGAVGGAYAGNHIEKSAKESKRYDFQVRFEDGSTRTFSGDTPPVWHSGDRVRLQNGTLTGNGSRSASDLGTV